MDPSTSRPSLKIAKLVVITSDLEVEGAVNRVLMEIVFGLHADFEIVILSTEGGKPFYSFPEDVRILQLGETAFNRSSRSRRALNTFRSIPEISRRINLEKPDAVLSMTVRPNLANVLARKLGRYPYKTIICEQNYNSRQYSNSVPEIAFRSLMKLVYPRADAVVAVAKDLSLDLISNFGVSEQNSYTIYNPFNFQRINALADIAGDVPWGQEAPLYFVNAGRLTKQKNHALLIHAFRRVRDQVDCRLLILGEGPLRPDLEKIIEKLGLVDQVFMPGWVGNPFYLFKKAQAFVLSSNHEGLPSVLIEALACGCPIISNDCPTGPREILEDGKYGVLVPVGDVHAFSQAMLNILNMSEQREELSTNGKERARCFDRERIIEQYRSLLIRVLDPHQQPAVISDRSH